jgi:thioredoxin 1
LKNKGDDVKKTRLVLSVLIFLLVGPSCSRAPSAPEAKQEPAAQPQEQASVPQESPSPADENIKVTFVELGSVNCIPCKMMQPVMKEIEEEYKSQVNVVFYDVWTSSGRLYGDKYSIRVIPTQVFLDANGKEYFRHEGFFPKEELVKILKQGGVE